MRKVDSILGKMLKKEKESEERYDLDRHYKEGFNYGSMIRRQGKDIDNKLISYKPNNFKKGVWDGFYNG